MELGRFSSSLAIRVYVTGRLSNLPQFAEKGPVVLEVQISLLIRVSNFG